MKEKLRKLILNGDSDSLRKILSEDFQIDNQELKKLIQLSKNKGVKIIQSILINRIPESIEFYSEKEKENLIVDLISEISQDIYAAGWYDKIEYLLWNWIEAEVQIPGYINRRVIMSDLEELKGISEKLNLWGIWENGNNPKAIKLMKWKTKFE